MNTRLRTTAARLAALALALALGASLAGCSELNSAVQSGIDSGRSSTGEGSTTSGYFSDSGSSNAEPVVGAPTVTSETKSDALGAGSAVSAGSTSASQDTAASVDTRVDRLVVVNKTLRLETPNVDASISSIRGLAAQYKGEISSLQVSTSGDQPVYPTETDGARLGTTDPNLRLQAYVTVRVPVDTYASFVAEASKLGTVLYEAEGAQDVTQQHVDMQARLKNMQAEQARLRALFTKANRVTDMLAIEQELTRVQGEIESMQAQIGYLENQAAMATVSIELAEPTPLVSPAGIDWGVSSAVTDAVRLFVGTFNVLIRLLGPVLALVLFLGVPVLLVVWLIVRATRRRKAAGVAAASAPAGSSGTDGPVE